ncbi:AAA domain-containing protein [Limibacter armeniacum]|uniref:AAA domain-containing protein n=1 Tax=Limibacter armeniacum TaxID=466084 RepID=UPI002FE5DA76
MEEIKHLRSLLKIERDEDFRQYEKNVLQTPLNERKRKGICWYPVIIKKSEIGTGEQFYITIERGSFKGTPHAFQVGDSVTFFSEGGKDDERLRGVVAAVWEDNMRIAVSEDELPDWLTEGNVGVDMLFDDVTYREMDYALKQLLELKAGRTRTLRDILLGEQPATFEKKVPNGFQPLETLNQAQNEAVAKVLTAKDIAVVHGPPGTGKTTTLVQVVKLVLQREKQVLVTAPSNTAVDLLTRKLAEKGIKVLRIGNPARVQDEVIQYSLDAQIEAHHDFKLLKKLRRDAEEAKRQAAKFKRNFGKEEREKRRDLYRDARQMLKEAEQLEEYIVESLTDKAQVITATLVGAVNKFIKDRKFSTVFIDEAAQALEPATWIPILKADKVVFAGDHCQLPPTVKSQQAAKEGLEETLFEKVMVRQKETSVMLEVQYRMNEQIMQFSNEQFYDGELKADDSVKNHVLSESSELPQLSTAVEFVDTAGCGYVEAMYPETQSRYNEEEAALLLRHLTGILQAYKAEGSVEQPSIGIISPYKGQVMTLSEHLLSDTVLREWSDQIQVQTVDGFQGQEKDIIYISLVRSNDEGSIGFLADTRRMNVALTRARKKLVVIGDSATLSSHSFYQSFLDYIDRIGAYHSAWEYME